MRRRLDNTHSYGKMFPTKSFYEKTFGQQTFLRQDLPNKFFVMRRSLDSTGFHDKMFSTRSFYENTVGQHKLHDKIFRTRPFCYENIFGQPNCLEENVFFFATGVFEETLQTQRFLTTKFFVSERFRDATS